MIRAESAAAPGREFRSIRTRLSIASWIPAVLLLVMCVIYGIFQAWPSFQMWMIGRTVQEVSIPAVPALSNLETERQLALAYLDNPAADSTALHAQQQRTDQGLAQMQAAANANLSLAPASIVASADAFGQGVAGLTRERVSISSRAVGAAQAYAFYNSLLDRATDLFDDQARIVTDASVGQSAIAAVALFRDTDMQSRAASLAAGALAADAFTPDDYAQFQSLTGYYHTDLATTLPYLQPDVRADYDRLITSTPYRQLTETENALIAQGPHGPTTTLGTGREQQTVRTPFPVDPATWANLTDSVGQQLTALTIQQADEIAAEAADVGSAHWWTDLAILLAQLAAAALAAWYLLRYSRSLARRTQSLTRWTRELATDVGPALLDQIHTGTDINVEVDVGTALAVPDRGNDEIGLLATEFAAAWHAIVSATVREAQQRRDHAQVLVGVARRLQQLVGRQLAAIEAMQQREQNPAALQALFELDNLITRGRRFATNLVILGGGTPPRRTGDPVLLPDIARTAQGEVRNYQRVRLTYFPDDLGVAAHVAWDLAHLCAELLDNATQFSPPDSDVFISAFTTATGAAMEITDMGPGVTADKLDVINTQLAAPLDVHEIATHADVSRIGLYVVALSSARSGITVCLRRSGYGGLTAVVWIPQKYIVTLPSETDQASTASTAPPDPQPKPAPTTRTLHALQAPRELTAAQALREPNAASATPAPGIEIGDTETGDTETADEAPRWPADEPTDEPGAPTASPGRGASTIPSPLPTELTTALTAAAAIQNAGSPRTRDAVADEDTALDTDLPRPASPPPGSQSLPPLTRRVPGDAMAAGLRGGPARHRATSPPAADPARFSSQMRALQRGSERGRHAHSTGHHDSPPSADAHPRSMPAAFKPADENGTP